MMDELHPVADLGMRVRELTLLHDVTRILQRDEPITGHDWLEEIAQAIQRSWPHPGTVAVRAASERSKSPTSGLDVLPVAAPRRVHRRRRAHRSD